MKIEKVNENQIRCTLTREDLAERQIKLSELAYGTEKAKLLFRDMMQQAAYEFGFEADDIPLMIEAIPLSADTIILVITKVEYPEELDTRFSKFSDPDPEDLFEDTYGSSEMSAASEGADDILGLFQKIQEERKQAAEAWQKENGATSSDGGKKKKEENPVNVLVDITKLFIFNELAEVTRLAHILDGFYKGSNDLYKNESTHKYYLLVRGSRQTPEEFNKVCNILSEYAIQQAYTPAIGAFFQEHYHSIIKGNALQTLAGL
ncbi:MAG: adaptor protein MecA [Roseburia sp.]|nr:adaptor protein MecA [Roseburia sp.]